MVARVEAERFGHRWETHEDYLRRLVLERNTKQREVTKVATIEFKGFVQAHENPKAPWTITEGHSVKEGDKWVVKSRTFHKVWLPKGVDSLPVDELVTVLGSQKTTVSDYQGEKKYNVVVYADSVTDRNGNPLADRAVPAAESWVPAGGGADAEVPF